MSIGVVWCWLAAMWVLVGELFVVVLGRLACLLEPEVAWLVCWCCTVCGFVYFGDLWVGYFLSGLLCL